jgi:hypothetical protein
MNGPAILKTWFLSQGVSVCARVCGVQEALQGGAEAAARVMSLESKLKVVVAEVDRVQEQATLTARLQVRHLRHKQCCLCTVSSPAACLTAACRRNSRLSAMAYLRQAAVPQPCAPLK